MPTIGSTEATQFETHGSRLAPTLLPRVEVVSYALGVSRSLPTS